MNQAIWLSVAGAATGAVARMMIAFRPPPIPAIRADHLFLSLTCLGCNDVVPVSRVARRLMIVEGTTGPLFLAVMMGRLVALYSRATFRETA